MTKSLTNTSPSQNTTRIFSLVRHGQVAGPAALYGHSDIALSDEGRTNLQRCLTQLHAALPCAALICSPLIRCAAVGQGFAREHDIELRLKPELREMNFGQWDGIAFDAMPTEQWQQLENFWQQPAQVTPPQGESLQQFHGRVVRAWETICAQNPGEHQLIICHGGVIRIIIAHILGLDYSNPLLFKQLHLGYASHSRIELSSSTQAQPLVKWIGAPC